MGVLYLLHSWFLSIPRGSGTSPQPGHTSPCCGTGNAGSRHPPRSRVCRLVVGRGDDQPPGTSPHPRPRVPIPTLGAMGAAPARSTEAGTGGMVAGGAIGTGAAQCTPLSIAARRALCGHGAAVRRAHPISALWGSRDEENPPRGALTALARGATEAWGAGAGSVLRRARRSVAAHAGLAAASAPGALRAALLALQPYGQQEQ